MEMLMTGRLLSAREAYDFHLVNRVFPDDRLDAMTHEWAGEIAKTSGYGIHMAKQVFYAQVEMTEWQAYQYTKEMMAMAGVSVNSTEGFTAFIEKREPVWDETTVF
jgi:enoyl-CoA hydratase/carnithine racemase